MPRGSRLARAAVFAAVCVTVTALGHVLMSGDSLPWWAVAYAFAGTASGAWWLTVRERGAVLVVGATVVTQALLHLLFAFAHRLEHASDTTAVMPGMDGDSVMRHQMALSSGGVLMQHPSGPSGMPSGSPLLSALTYQGSAGMVLAHLLAAVVCGLWLWRGEAAAHRIGRALAAALFAPLRRVCRVLFRTAPETRTPSCGPAAGVGENRRPADSSLRHAVVRRGPPRVPFGGQPPVSRSEARRTAVLAA